MASNVYVTEGRAKAKLYLLYVSRSDGKSEIAVKKGATESNMPTPEQLRKVKLGNGLYTFYQEIPIGDAKHMDWRRKLGGLLAKEAHRQMKQKGELPANGPFSKDEIQMEEFCLADFPENYRLWEHRRSANLDNPNAPSRNDRRDAYLYGHPLGRKKRYRSPADFYYHLEWMVFDVEGDPENCRCKICTPDEVIKAGEDMRQIQVKLFGSAEEKAQLKAQLNEPKQQQVPSVPVGNTQVLADSSVKKPLERPPVPSAPVVMSRQGSASKSVLRTATPLAPAATPTPKPSDPIPLVPPRHPDQAIDQMVNTFIYRVGELVWYTRDSGAVGLAVIVARNRSVDSMGAQSIGYIVQPLSHPYRHPERVHISAERRIVPWLAYSLPPCTHASLQDSDQQYDGIRWDMLLNDRSGDTEVDGSIFAAKAIDSTFTLVHMLPLTDAPTMELGYNGIYLGGELIWVGEAIRIRGDMQRNKGNGIMIVSKIVERLHTGSKPSEVFLIGDTYELQTAQHNPARPHPPNRYLPQKVQEDLKYRNGPRIARRGEEMHWKFLEGQRRVSLGQVNGRWYESRSVLPIVQGDSAAQQLNQQLETGDIPDVAPSLNIRGSCSLPDGQAGNKKPERIQAFSRSVPPDTVLQISFEDAPGRTQQPSVDVAMMSRAEGLGQGNGNGPAGFVHIDLMDESGYAQAFR